MREYLQLTSEQWTRIRRNTAEFSEWEQAKRERAMQVHEELAVEAAREVLVPGALGIRWAEIEGIRRHIAERQMALYKTNQGVLTDAQKSKFKTLEDAAKLDPVAWSARYAQLLASPFNACGSPFSLIELLSRGLVGIGCVGSPQAFIGGSSMGMLRVREFLRP